MKKKHEAHDIFIFLLNISCVASLLYVYMCIMMTIHGWL